MTLSNDATTSAAHAATRDRFPEVDCQSIWEKPPGEDWILEPVLAKGRGVVIYSPAKAGKSLLMLEMAVRASRGDAMFGHNGDGQPHHILYVDFENDPQNDIVARLKAMGFTLNDLEYLHYLSFPSLRPMDTDGGGVDLLTVALAYGAEAVVVDTASRTISGPENDNDTWLAWYRHTGLRLKQANIAYVRLDHTGKDESKGQRGGSAKSGDVDAIWKLTADAKGEVVILRCEDKRFPITETYLPMRRQESPLGHHLDRTAAAKSRETLLQACIADLDRLGIPATDGRTKAWTALKEAGATHHSSRIVGAAQQARREPEETL